MKGPLDVLGALCTVQCARYYKKYRKTMNSLDKANPQAVKEFEEWMED